MKVFFYIFCLMALVSCGQKQVENQPETTFQNEEIKPVEGYQVIAIQNGPESFGYHILKNGKVFIKQETIPAIQGNRGFSSSEKALKTGEFVLRKIETGIFPPTISPEEMDSLGVL